MKQTQTIPVHFWILAIALVILCLPDQAFAAIDSKDMFENIIDQFKSKGSLWQTEIFKAAQWLFIALAIISFTWTFILLALKRGDIGEFVGEIIRYTMFTGFYYWLLISSPGFGLDIIDSMVELASKASGFPEKMTPSIVSDMGFKVFYQTTEAGFSSGIAVGIVSGILSIGLLIIFALIATNMLIMMCAAWIMLYAGMFFLGFGGGRWTSDIAINYYKSCLSIGTGLYSMILILGIGVSFLNGYVTNMSQGIYLNELAVMLITALIVYLLVDRVPPMISGIITGMNIGSLGVGQFGAGAAFGAAATAAGAAAGGLVAGASALKGGAESIIGGASAVAAAFKSAQQEISGGGGGNSISESGSAGSDSKSSGGFGEKMGNAAKVTGVAASKLAGAAGSTLANSFREKMASFMDKATNETVGGSMASEIKNPGDRKEAVKDNKDISKAGAHQASESRKSAGSEARDYMASVTNQGRNATGNPPPKRSKYY